MKNILKKIGRTVTGDYSEVLITPKGARFGNLLYFFLRACIYKSEGRSLKILETSHFTEIIKLFPKLAEFVITEKEVKFYHHKDADNNFYQVFGSHFNNDQLNHFIEIYLIGSIEPLHKIPSELCINVRRGDFYEQGNTSIYGYDQIGFLKHVFEKHLNPKYFQNIKIISDNMLWCKEELSFLNKYTDQLIFPTLENSIEDGFKEVINSKALILSNSTFSFWAAYISNFIFNNTSQTYCPIFGSRKISNTDLYQTNPSWNIISDFNF
ncbi:alpha-1,2-fucosyltransferase [Chryseobacterium zhengzhouense]|uniref:Alpha-1,2-fucosyltransferase n=1 Tax=Chryseobacterium zhengzhouense TaxID=1636086 RepID=A0ABW2LZH4_9FLAO